MSVFMCLFALAANCLSLGDFAIGVTAVASAAVYLVYRGIETQHAAFFSANARAVIC